MAKDEHLFLFDMHHIISDGTSMEILTDDFIKLYHGEELLPLAVQYKDFACWQNDLFESGKIKEQENYWKNLLPDAQEIPRLNLPLDYPRPDIFTFEGGIYRLVLDGETSSQLKRLCATNSGTLFMNLVAALNALLYKYTSQDDIIIGSSIAGRPHNDLQPVIGMFINELIIRNHPRGEKQYPEFFEEVKESCLNAFENQDVQFEDLVDKLNPERDPSRNPIFDVCLVVLNFEKSKGEIKGASFTPYSSEITTSKFDITIFAVDVNDKILFNLEYCRTLFKKETMERLARHFKNIIQQICKNPDSQLYDLEIFDEEEKHQLLYECNQTDTQYAGDRTTHELFEKQVEKTPDRTAVVFNNQSLCYSALEAKANQVANYLLTAKHLLPDDRVGILMDRSIELIAGIMGILKAGAAYIPIEPSSPEERIKTIINDAGIEIVISQKRYIKILNRLQWECKDFHTFLCMDSTAIHTEEEIEKNELMDEKLWEYVGENAADEITGGGWISSYTGQPFSKEEMEEYGDNILKKVTPLLHEKMRVLEIGCASGITMYRIAPHVAFYYGTDLSRVIIQKNKEQVKQQGLLNIALTCLPAHEINKLDETDFDLVILNSVIQSFHGHNYLRKIIADCIELLKEKGFIFIGDIMNQQLKRKLIQDLNAFKQANQSNGSKTKVDWSSELFVSPGFFQDLTVEIPGIQAVQFSDKIHTIPNELTKFRYDALLTIDKGNKPKSKIKAKQKYQEDLTRLQPLSINRPRVPMNSRNLAYIIYTSGTTGIPKGVTIQHQSLVNYAQWGIRQYIDGDHFYFPLYTSISFDLTVTSIFLPLLSGGVIVVYPDGQSGLPILDVFARGGVQVVKATPSHLKLLQDEVKRVNNLKRFIVGGEALERILAAGIYRDFSGEIEIYNEYGPTEATVGCMIYKFDHEHDRRNMVPIGVPIDNAKIFILDRDMNPVPTNAMGEIYIGGDALTRGYVNQPELTREKICLRRPGALFEKTAPGPRKNFLLAPDRSTYYPVYRTGDLAKRLPDGNIEFLGRRDDQVKIRGYRIEIEEIENRLKEHNDIKEAVILMLKRTPDLSDLLDQTDDYLCCYWVPAQARVSLDTVEIKTYLAKHIPDYMIPSYFVQLEKIPLTPNGKVNRKTLPEPGVVEVGDDYIAPANEVERKLVEIWSQVLGIDKNIIGTRTNFFQLGGHSLRATIVISRIHKELNVKIPLAEIFKNPVIKELAQYIIHQEKDIYKYISPVEKREYYPQSSAQKRLFFLDQFEDIGTSYNMPYIFKIRGEMDAAYYKKVFNTLIASHEALRTSLALVDSNPVQRVHDRVDFEIEYYDLQVTGASDRTGREGVDSFIRPFDLSRAPLLRAGFMKSTEQECLLLVDMHHIISDGTSISILTRDFISSYMGGELAPLRVQYKDFSMWQNHLFKRGEIKKQEEYWLNLYPDMGSIPMLNLPTDYPRKKIFDFDGATYQFKLDKKVTGAFKELANENGATLYMNLLAVFNVLLHKYCGKDDIIVGTGIAGRPHADLENIIGMFVNTLAVRNYPRGEKTYLEFLKEVKENCVKAFENQDMQFEELVNRISSYRTPSKNPIFSVELNVQNYERPTPGKQKVESAGDSQVTHYGFEKTTSKFDLILFATEIEDEIHFMLEYSTALFKPSTIEKMAQRYIQVIEQVVENKTLKIKEIKIVHDLIEARPAEISAELQL